MIADLLAQVTGEQKKVPDAPGGELLEEMLKEGPAIHRYHGFGHGIREWTQANATPATIMAMRFGVQVFFSMRRSMPSPPPRLWRSEGLSPPVLAVPRGASSVSMELRLAGEGSMLMVFGRTFG